jgi:hypothetical protein
LATVAIRMIEDLIVYIKLHDTAPTAGLVGLVSFD